MKIVCSKIKATSDAEPRGQSINAIYHIDGIDGCWAIELYDKNNVKYSIQGQINHVRIPKNPNIKNYEEQLTLHYYSGFLKKEIDEVIKPFFIELLEQIEGVNS